MSPRHNIELLPHVIQDGPLISPYLSRPFSPWSLPHHPTILHYVYALSCGPLELAGTYLLTRLSFLVSGLLNLLGNM